MIVRLSKNGWFAVHTKYTGSASDFGKYLFYLIYYLNKEIIFSIDVLCLEIALGFGTQFAPELNEDQRIVDSPVEREQPAILPHSVVDNSAFSPVVRRQDSE